MNRRVFQKTVKSFEGNTRTQLFAVHVVKVVKDWNRAHGRRLACRIADAAPCACYFFARSRK